MKNKERSLVTSSGHIVLLALCEKLKQSRYKQYLEIYITHMISQQSDTQPIFNIDAQIR